MIKQLMDQPDIYTSFPSPIALVSCSNGEGKGNVITLAWVGTVCSEPPVLSIAIRRGKYSHGLIKASGEFVVNVPTEELLRATDICGTLSGRNTDKWQRAGLTPAPASRVRAPLIAECPISLECVVRETLSPGSHDVFLGEVVASHVEERLLRPDGKVDSSRVRPLVYFMREYWALGREKLADRGVGMR